jgi:trk system potassium uptake protein TrkH
MRPRFIIRLIGLFLLLFSITFVPPALIAAFSHDGQLRHFIESALIIGIPGLLLWLPTRSHRGNLHSREVYIVVALFWILLGMLGGIPFVMGAHLNVTDAVFEAVSGFTTTGSTVIIGIDNLPPSVLMYRQQLQWIGGLGVIVIAVAILPMLGVGGMQLLKAEVPGPTKDERLTPRIANTARYLLVIYFLLTVACTIAYWLAGMTVFDAISHAFAALSTGGYSTHDDSIGYFHSGAIEAISIVFMLLGAISFNLHFFAFFRQEPGAYWKDPQTRAFIFIVTILIVVVSVMLYAGHTYKTFWEALRYGAFQTISVITTTGFMTANLSAWPLGLPLLLMLTSFIGGCAGSTSGGIKVIRMVVLGKVGLRELARLIHPQLVSPIKVGERALSKTVIDAIWGFFSVYVMVFVLMVLLVMASGVDQVTAFGAVATCINNTGPGLGVVAVTFHDLNPVAKWLCAAAMLLGRLEIFTLLVLITPEFWRK